MKDTDFLKIGKVRGKGYKTQLMDDEACKKLMESLQNISSAAVDIELSANGIELKRYIRKLTRDTQRLFEISDQAEDPEEKTEDHGTEIDTWNIHYDIDCATDTAAKIKKMTQSENARRKQQTTYAPKLKDLTKEQRYIVDKAMEKLASGKQMMMLIHGPPGTGKTKFIASTITSLTQRNYNIQTKFLAYTGVAAAQGRGSTMHDYLGIGYSGPSWPTTLSDEKIREIKKYAAKDGILIIDDQCNLVRQMHTKSAQVYDPFLFLIDFKIIKHSRPTQIKLNNNKNID